LSSNGKVLGLTALAIAVSVALSLSVTVIFNYTYVNQQFTNIYTLIAGIKDNQTTTTPIIINVPPSNNQSGNQSTPVPPVNNTPPTPVPPVNNTPPTPIPTCKTDEVYDPVTKECVAKNPQPSPTPTPTPTPTPLAITFTAVGDIEGDSAGTSVFNTLKKQNATYDFVLGDLGYAKDISWFKQTYGSLGDKMNCVGGNHESSNEDGTAALQAETLKYCGNSYWFKSGVNLFFFFNTNGDLDAQRVAADKALHNSTITAGVKNLFILSHKPYQTGPNQHHPATEAPKVVAMFAALEKSIPTGIKTYYIAGHNHVMSQSADKKFTTTGAGGRSHYTCAVNTAFPFCDNVHFGFVKVSVTATGQVTFQFLDYNGKIVK